MLRSLKSVLSALALASATSASATDIQFWHAMSGASGQELDKLVQRFNDSQKDVKVVATAKGDYVQTLNAALDAHRGGQSPHLVQVFEVGTATIMAAKGATRPVAQVLDEAGVRLDAKAFVPAVASYFSDANGRLLAMPFNTSTPVLYINRDIFRKAKLDPDKPPKTWYEMVATLGAIKEDVWRECAFTTTYPSWILVENMSAWHNHEFATNGNGLGGLDAKLVFNTRLMVRWISVLTSWHKAGYYTYSGRGADGEKRFAAGDCGILAASSSFQGDLRRMAKFDWSVAQLPYYDDFEGVPQNTLIGGAGLWAMAGKKADEYRGVAKFLAYLAQADVQAEWSQATGYVPITTAAYEQLKKAGFYTQNPGHEIAVRQLLTRNPTKDSKGIRIGSFLEVRNVVEEELELAWAEKKSPKDALDKAVDRGNELLRKFEVAHRGSQPAAAKPAAEKPAKKAPPRRSDKK
jgi:sn-glycerol 3-phosphate transport system substrate-binding protein